MLKYTNYSQKVEDYLIENGFIWDKPAPYSYWRREVIMIDYDNKTFKFKADESAPFHPFITL
jgi:hypothetical protein